MIKTIIKEFCIILLLCVAIVLALGVVFYEYVPITKVIPEKVSYTVPENIKNELQQETAEEMAIQTTVYEITTSDLRKYENIGIYDKGKVNPFSITNQTNSNTVNENTTSNNATSNNTTTSEGTSGNLFNTVGK